MAQHGAMIVVREGVTVQRLADGRLCFRLAEMPLILTVQEVGMLWDLAQDALVGGDGCGQWRASQARWNGQRWCCPQCGRVITFPF
jgi:hypothetical protein